VVDGTEVSSKTLRVVMDPKVSLTGEARVAYDGFLRDLHAQQQAGADVAASLTALANPMATVKARLDSMPAVPEATKSQFTALAQAFDSVRVKFGVAPGRASGAAAAAGGPPAGGGGGGGAAARLGAGAGANADVLARVGQIKGLVAGIWETPSEGSRKQAAAAVADLRAAMTEANTVLQRARALESALATHGLSLNAAR
jgi:hypothetical protein